MNTQFLNEKLEECKHFDKDNRYVPVCKRLTCI